MLFLSPFPLLCASQTLVDLAMGIEGCSLTVDLPACSELDCLPFGAYHTPFFVPKYPLQLEELVAGTNNGRSPQLAGYYSFWEQAVFNALAVMLLRGLDRLHTMFGPAAKQPLFRVSPACWLPAPVGQSERRSCPAAHSL
jgi:hypothetical protein